MAYYPQLRDSIWFPQFHPCMGWNLGEEAFGRASMRVLFVFPSSIGVRSISATHQVLYNILRAEFGDDVFVDICMKPIQGFESAYYKRFPSLVGFLSLHSWEDFDIIGFSLAISVLEVPEVPLMLKRAGIPVMHRDRMESRYPLIVAGGVAVEGQAYLDNVVDLYMYGLGERNLPRLVGECFRVQADLGSVSSGRERLCQTLPHLKGFVNPRLYRYRHSVVSGAWVSDFEGCDIPGLEHVSPDSDLPAEVISVGDSQLRLPLPGTWHHRVVLQTSFGCGGLTSQCTFCREGNVQGAWRERTTEDILQGLHTAKATSMGDAFTYFSFNSSFRSDYIGDLARAVEWFDSLSALNFRMDSVSGSILSDPESNIVSLVRYLGGRTFASPIEGVSQRMRAWLNKNLTESDILTVFEEVFRRRFIRLKVGVIDTFYETKEDYAELFDLLDRAIDLRAKVGGETQISVAHTPLIHHDCTPLFWKPRYSSAMAWKEFFTKLDGGNYFYYPWLPAVDRGVTVRHSANALDTLLAQSLIDIPGPVLEEAWLQPSLSGRVKPYHPSMLESLRETFVRHGVSPRSQWLERDFGRHHLHHARNLRLEQGVKRLSPGSSPADIVDLSASTHAGLGSCLVTPATVVKGNLSKCLACGSCSDIDKCRAEMGLPKSTPHVQFMQRREVSLEASLAEVKARVMEYSPAFFYRLVFRFPDSSRFMSKEHLVRRWLVALASVDDRYVREFRRIESAVYKGVDYKCFPSIWSGYDAVVAGFLSQLSPDFADHARQADSICGGAVSLVSFSQVETKSSPHVLFDFRLRTTSAERRALLDYLGSGEWQVYNVTPTLPKVFRMPSRHKVVESSDFTRVLLACQPRVNPVYSAGLSVWSLPKLADRFDFCRVRSLLSPSPDGYVDLVTGRLVPVHGMTVVSGEDTSSIDEDEITIDGA